MLSCKGRVNDRAEGEDVGLVCDKHGRTEDLNHLL